MAQAWAWGVFWGLNGLVGMAIPSSFADECQSDSNPVPFTSAEVQARALFGQAMNEENHGSPVRAAELYEQATSLAPDYLAPILARGTLAFESQDYRVAEECYSKALGLRPGDLDLLLTLARTHLALEEPGAALFLLDPALAGGWNEELAMAKVEALAHLGDKAGAVEVLSRFVPGKTFDQALQLLLRMYELDDDLAPAIELAKGLVARSPDDGVLRARYTHLLLRAQEYGRAADLMEQTLKQNPKDHDLRRALVQLYGGPFPNAARVSLHERILERSNTEKSRPGRNP